ncbi:MAG: hypothetical protein PHC34_02920 [Candidatus Gastranaerophilales bacterium]|nr:hypothetical protein [Candidatus Gastranaerophilales bacterium]
MDLKEQVLGIIRNQISELDDSLDDVKIQFADSCLAENDWQCKTDRKIACKKVEAQIQILEKMEMLIEDAIIPRPMGAAI